MEVVDLPSCVSYRSLAKETLNALRVILAICSVSLSSRLVLFEYWCYDKGEHSSEILSVSWVQIRCVCEVLLASWWNECVIRSQRPRETGRGEPFWGWPFSQARSGANNFFIIKNYIHHGFELSSPRAAFWAPSKGRSPPWRKRTNNWRFIG